MFHDRSDRIGDYLPGINYLKISASLIDSRTFAFSTCGVNCRANDIAIILRDGMLDFPALAADY